MFLNSTFVLYLDQNSLDYNSIKICEKTRDNLIGYLATFDLLLSLTMPFTALDVLSKYWPLGRNTQLLARICRALPSIIIYSSSMIIIVIALNCYRQVLHSSKKQLSPRKLRYIVVLIISVATVVSVPIFYFTKLDPLIEGVVNPFAEEANSSNNHRNKNTDFHCINRRQRDLQKSVQKDSKWEYAHYKKPWRI